MLEEQRHHASALLASLGDALVGDEQRRVRKGVAIHLDERHDQGEKTVVGQPRGLVRRRVVEIPFAARVAHAADVHVRQHRRPAEPLAEEAHQAAVVLNVIRVPIGDRGRRFSSFDERYSGSRLDRQVAPFVRVDAEGHAAAVIHPVFEEFKRRARCVPAVIARPFDLGMARVNDRRRGERFLSAGNAFARGVAVLVIVGHPAAIRIPHDPLEFLKGRLAHLARRGRDENRPQTSAQRRVAAMTLSHRGLSLLKNTPP